MSCCYVCTGCADVDALTASAGCPFICPCTNDVVGACLLQPAGGCQWMTKGDATAAGANTGTVSPISLPLSGASRGVSSCAFGSQSQLGNFFGALLSPVAKAASQAGAQALGRTICAASGGPQSRIGTIQPNTLLLVGAGLVAIVVVFGMRGR